MSSAPGLGGGSVATETATSPPPGREDDSTPGARRGARSADAHRTAGRGARELARWPAPSAAATTTGRLAPASICRTVFRNGGLGERDARPRRRRRTRSGTPHPPTRTPYRLSTCDERGRALSALRGRDRGRRARTSEPPETLCTQTYRLKKKMDAFRDAAGRVGPALRVVETRANEPRAVEAGTTTDTTAGGVSDRGQCVRCRVERDALCHLCTRLLTVQNDGQ